MAHKILDNPAPPNQASAANTFPARNPDGLPALLIELRNETTTLMRQEVALAKTELAEKVHETGDTLAKIAVAGIVAAVGLTFLLVALNEGVAIALRLAGLEVHAAWLAPLLTGLVIGAIGLAVLKSKLADLKEGSLVPKKTIQTLKEDKQWIQDKMK